MRLDHLLSREKGEVGAALLFVCRGAGARGDPRGKEDSGGDAPGGDTRTHTEHGPVLARGVKTRAADGTMLGTAWESRWLPEHI